MTRKWQWWMALGMAALAGAARANTGEVVVTATRGYTDAARTAGSITVIEGEEIAKRGVETLADILKDVPGVQVRSQGSPLGEVAMRGGGENAQGRVLVLLDGRRLNSPDMAVLNWLQIPLNAIERIEIFRGSQSALYGDYAANGVIQIITKKGAGAPQVGASLVIGSDQTAVVRGGAAGSVRDTAMNYAVNLEWQASDGYRDRSAHHGGGLGGRIGYDLGTDSGLWLAGSLFESTYELPGYLSKAEMDDDPRQARNPDDEVRNRHGHVGLDYAREWENGAQLDVKVGWLSKKMESDMVSWFSYTDTDTDGLSVQPSLRVNSGFGGLTHRTTVGFDGYWDTLKADRFADEGRTLNMIAAELSRRTLGGYVRHEVETGANWIWSAGARIEDARLDADADAWGMTVLDDRKSHMGYAWELGATYAFEKGSKAFARVGRIFRYPFLDEQVSYYGFGTDALYGDLEAESGMNGELGLELGCSPDWRTGLTAFWMEMKDEVAWDPVLYRNANLDRTRRLGSELWGEWSPVSGLMVKGSYTFTHATFTAGANDGKDVPLVPAHAARLAATARLPLALEAEAGVRYTGTCRLGGDYANAGVKLDAYTVGDAALRFRPDGRAYSAFVAVDNLWDTDYATVAYKGFFEDGYYPAAGRQWRAGVEVAF